MNRIQVVLGERERARQDWLRLKSNPESSSSTTTTTTSNDVSSPPSVQMNAENTR